MDAEEEIVRNSRRIFRNKIRNTLAESGNDDDASKLYTKTLFVLKRITTFGSSLPIELGGGYKWNLGVRRSGSSLTVVLFSDTYGNPRLDFYALLTSAIIHPLDPEITDCHDAFLYVSKGNSSCLINYADACEKGFLDAEGNVKVELQIQVIGENVFPPLIVRKFQIELLLTYTKDLDCICSRFIERTQYVLKNLVQDNDKWSRFCTFMKKRGQNSRNQMFWEKQDVIKEGMVNHFFVDGVVTSPLLLEILYNGYQSINANNTTTKFVRIDENRFELVGDVPSLFKSVVSLEYKPVKVNTATIEDYESNLTKLGCMIVEIYVLDYLFRNKIEQNDESIAALLEEDTSVPDTVRAKLNDLFTNALKNHEVIATTLIEKIDALIAEPQEESVAWALKNVVTKLYTDAEEMVAVLYVEVDEERVCRTNKRLFRDDIRNFLEFNNIVESGNDESKIYTKALLTLKPISGSDPSSSLRIELGDYKWIFEVCLKETSLPLQENHCMQFVLLPDTYNNPKLNFYSLITLAIIHPLDPERTVCFDAFSFVCKACTGNVFVLVDPFPNYYLSGRVELDFLDFLDAEGNVKVELQIQVIGENVFPPFLVLKFRRELFMAYSIDLNDICSTFFEKTIENLKSMVEDKIKWPRFCTFIKESGQVSKDQMFCEKQDVIKESLVKHFFVDGVVTSPLLMEILYNGYQSINGNNTTAKFVRIEENRFELVGDVPSLFKRVVALEYKPVYVEVDDDATVEDYESNLTKLGCMVVEIYVLDYLFRNKIEVNFTRSELIQTEKMSKKKGKEKAKAKKNDKCVEENKEQVNLNLAVNGWLQQNDESIAAVSEEDTSVPEKVRAKLNGSFLNALKNQECATTSVPYRVRAKLIDLFMNALKNHEVIAATLKEKINALIAEAQEEHVACELLKAATELYIDAQKKIADLYFKARVEIESLEIISVLNIPGYVIWTRRSDLVSKEGTRETIYYQALKNRKTL